MLTITTTKTTTTTIAQHNNSTLISSATETSATLIGNIKENRRKQKTRQSTKRETHNQEKEQTNTDDKEAKKRSIETDRLHWRVAVGNEQLTNNETIGDNNKTIVTPTIQTRGGGVSNCSNGTCGIARGQQQQTCNCRACELNVKKINNEMRFSAKFRAIQAVSSFSSSSSSPTNIGMNCDRLGLASNFGIRCQTTSATTTTISRLMLLALSLYCCCFFYSSVLALSIDRVSLNPNRVPLFRPERQSYSFGDPKAVPTPTVATITTPVPIITVNEPLVVPRWLSYDVFRVAYAPVRRSLWLHERVKHESLSSPSSQVKWHNNATNRVQLNSNRTKTGDDDNYELRKRTYVETAIKVLQQRARYRANTSHSLAYINELSDWTLDELHALKEAFYSLPTPSESSTLANVSLSSTSASTSTPPIPKSNTHGQQRTLAGEIRIDDWTMNKVRHVLTSAANDHHYQQALVDELRATRDEAPFALSLFARHTLALAGTPAFQQSIKSQSITTGEQSSSRQSHDRLALAPLDNNKLMNNNSNNSNNKHSDNQSMANRQLSMSKNSSSASNSGTIDAEATRRAQAALEAQIVSQLERQINQQLAAQFGPSLGLKVRTRQVLFAPPGGAPSPNRWLQSTTTAPT